MVLDKVNLDDQGDDSGSEDEPGSEDNEDSRSEPEGSDESEEDKDNEPRRSVRIREPPERLNPSMTGQSYATKKMNIKMKRRLKKDIKLRTKKKFREEHYNLYTQGIRTEADCMEYTNL